MLHSLGAHFGLVSFFTREHRGTSPKSTGAQWLNLNSVNLLFFNDLEPPWPSGKNEVYRQVNFNTIWSLQFLTDVDN